MTVLTSSHFQFADLRSTMQRIKAGCQNSTRNPYFVSTCKNTELSPSSARKTSIIPAMEPLPSALLMFRADVSLLSSVNLEFECSPVQEYKEGPPRCYRCQRFGHFAESCRGDQRCRTRPRPHKCSNCGGLRIASFLHCVGRRDGRYGASITHAKTETK